MCLTETQKKVDDIKIVKDVKIIQTMREMQDRKGGGLLIMYKEKEKYDLQKMTTRSTEILHVEGEIGKEQIRIVLVYMKTGNDNETKEHNKKIIEEIGQIVEEKEIQQKATIVLGDFNGHLGYLGNQEENMNGKLINKMIQEDLILLNIDSRCKGTYTWQREQKSAIDLIMVNQCGYEKFDEMEVDEKREIYDLSDHCMVRLRLKIKKNKQKKEKEETIEKYRLSQGRMNNYKKEVKDRLTEKEDIDIMTINKIMKESAEKHLKVKIKITKEKAEEKDKKWMTEQIRKEIKKRKEINRQQRNENREREKHLIWERYKEQTIKVRELIKNEIRKHEEKIVEEIKQDKGGKELWKNIRKISGKEVKKKELRIYDEDGKELEEIEAKEKIERFWKQIYQTHQNKIEEYWNQEEKETYEREMERIEEQDREETNEDIPRLVLDPYKKVKVNRFEISEEEVRKVIEKLKTGKSAGLDGLRAELYKELIKDRRAIEKLTASYKKVLEEKQEPTEWKKSKTIMIPKNNRPTETELRPIAMTDVSYKILMSLIGREIENHIAENKIDKFEQAGFTKGGNILDNLFILRECVEETYRKKEQMVAIAIDFKKAYDSIKRETMVQILKELRIDSKIIDFIVRIYREDSTKIQLEKNKEIEIEVTSGIRQGCTASTVLFKLITYKIIEETRKTEGIQILGPKITCLFYADDGLILAKDKEKAERSIEIIREIGGKYGLQLNERKSQCILFNMKEKYEKISNIEVVEEIKYLGVIVQAKRNVFEGQKNEIMKKIKRLSVMTNSVIEKVAIE